MMRLLSQARALANPREFAYFLDPIQPERMKEVAVSTGYDYRAHKIFFEPYFRGLLLFTWSPERTLRDLHQDLSKDPLYAVLGAHLNVSVSGLSQANANRPVTPFLMLLDDVLAQLRHIPARYRILRQIESQDLEQIELLLEKMTLFDSTTLSLPPTIASWAQSCATQAGVKVHLRLRAGVGGIDQAIAVPGRHHDSRYFQELLDLTPGAGWIYSFDCGYWGIATYDAITESDNFFLTALHGKLSFEVVEERPLPSSPGDSGYQLLRDCIVHIGKDERRSPHPYRLVEALDTRGRKVRILTNLLDEPVDHICWLKRYHWMIEILFRWLKHTLGLDHLISYSPRGIIMQVAVTLIAWGLMVLYHQRRAGKQPFSPTELLRDIRVALHHCLYQAGYRQGFLDALASLGLVSATHASLSLPPP